MRAGPVVLTAAAVVAVRILGLALVLPVFVPWAGQFTASSLMVGIAFGAYGLTMAIGQVPFGALSDRVGRRAALLLALGIAAVGSLWAARADGIVELVLARLVQGGGATASIGFALVADTVRPERRTQALAVIGIAAGGSFVVGIAIGPVLAASLGVRGLFDVSAALHAAALLPVLVWVPGGRPARPLDAAGPWRALGDRTLAAPQAGGFLLNAALAAVMFALPARLGAADDPSSVWRGLLPMVLVGALGMGVLARVADKGPLGPVTGAMLALLGVGAWLVTPRWGGAALTVAGSAFFVAHSTLSATLPSLVARLGRAAHRGAVMGSYNTSQYLGTFAGGALAGALAARPGVLGAMLATAGILLAAAVWRTPPAPGAGEALKRAAASLRP